MALSKPLPHLKLHDIKNSSDTLDLYIQYLNASNTTVFDMIRRAKEICEELPDINDPFIETLKLKDKGSLGKLLEYLLFGQKPNCDSNPDLLKLCLDLKVTHFKKLKNGNYNAKERLTITNCGTTDNYETFHNIVNSKTLQDCKYYVKCQKGLLFVVEHSEGKYKSIQDIIQQKVICICRYNMTDFKHEHLIQIDADYSNIRERISNQTVSQKGQKYLHIHPHGCKGSHTRALGFTNKFLTILVAEQLAKNRNIPLENILVQKGNSISIKI